MANAREFKTGTSDDPGPRVSLFSDLTVTELGLVYEEQAYAMGFRSVAGVDEVGRGCLAGPVVAAACILDPSRSLPDGLNDSKQLSRQKREEISDQLRAECVAYGIGQVEADEIDEINILQASIKAMLLAVDSLVPAADHLLIDAVALKQSRLPQKSIIKGDCVSASIAAASIIAKTFRDDLMRSYHEQYPEYSFCENVGYGTAAHLRALRERGPCALHRRSFRGVLNDPVSETGAAASRVQ